LENDVKKKPLLLTKPGIKTVSSIKNAHNQLTLVHEGEILKSRNLGTVYKHINSRLTHESGVAPLQDGAGDLKYKDEDKALLLNYHFVTVGQLDNRLLPVIVPLLDCFNSLTEVNFEEYVVTSKLKVLKTNSSPGPDGIYPILLSNLSNQLGRPLSLIYNFVFLNGTLPSE